MSLVIIDSLHEFIFRHKVGRFDRTVYARKYRELGSRDSVIAGNLPTYKLVAL